MSTPAQTHEVPLDLELTTERLRLRIPEPKLAAALAQYYIRNTDHFAPYAARRPEGFHAVGAWRERIAITQRACALGQTLHLVLSARAGAQTAILGDIHYTNIVRGAFQATHLGYQLDRDAVGQGLMYEALTATNCHLFEVLGLHRIMANYVPTNERSGRLLRRLGFQVEGYARDYLFLDGCWKDHVLTALVNPKPQPAL